MPVRSEIDNEFKWAVNDLYSTDEVWEKDYRKVCEDAGQPGKYKGHIGDSADNLYNALKEYENAEYVAEKVYVYAFMKYYEDTGNATYQEMSGKAQIAVMKVSEKYAFLEPELVSIPEEKLAEFFKCNEKLAEYRHFIEDCLAQKEHTLSEKEETLLAKASQMSTVPNEVFSKFNNADVRFGKIKSEDGTEIELTNGNYATFMESQNRTVRKEAFEALYKQYKAYINTLASAFYGNVKQAMFYAQARGYASTLNMYLDGSFIPESVYKNLIDTVNKNLDKMHRYVEIRKNALKVDELHFYDIYAPMVEDISWKITYEEAREIVIKALEPMGEEYVSHIKEGFDNGWVDVYENTGKRSGAFSWGAYGTHPYVFLNYQNTLNDVFTLIHEMGHAMHTYYSNTSQPYIYAGYKIFVAEVASTCNEALLMQYMLKNTEDEKKRRYLLNHFYEQFKGTLYRQTMFAEFEMEAHARAERGEVLSAESLCEMYRQLNEKYFGENMVIDEEIACEWARIPHFYTPFYVYQYATGYSAAIAISSRILAGDESVIKGYRQFLSGGCSKHPIELLKLCGIDMNSPQVVQDALDVFGELLSQW
ncbi:MAG: oligoendopeptidase F [Clostridia bacterium]|nr:oligoendopeptidase F [Clostridia bacterium]